MATPVVSEPDYTLYVSKIKPIIKELLEYVKTHDFISSNSKEDTNEKMQRYLMNFVNALYPDLQEDEKIPMDKILYQKTASKLLLGNESKMWKWLETLFPNRSDILKTNSYTRKQLKGLISEYKKRSKALESYTDEAALEIFSLFYLFPDANEEMYKMITEAIRKPLKKVTMEDDNPKTAKVTIGGTPFIDSTEINKKITQYADEIAKIIKQEPNTKADIILRIKNNTPAAPQPYNIVIKGFGQWLELFTKDDIEILEEINPPPLGADPPKKYKIIQKYFNYIKTPYDPAGVEKPFITKLLLAVHLYIILSSLSKESIEFFLKLLEDSNKSTLKQLFSGITVGGSRNFARLKKELEKYTGNITINKRTRGGEGDYKDNAIKPEDHGEVTNLINELIRTNITQEEYEKNKNELHNIFEKYFTPTNYITELLKALTEVINLFTSDNNKETTQTNLEVKFKDQEFIQFYELLDKKKYFHYKYLYHKLEYLTGKLEKNEVVESGIQTGYVPNINLMEIKKKYNEKYYNDDIIKDLQSYHTNIGNNYTESSSNNDEIESLNVSGKIYKIPYKDKGNESYKDFALAAIQRDIDDIKQRQQLQARLNPKSKEQGQGVAEAVAEPEADAVVSNSSQTGTTSLAAALAASALTASALTAAAAATSTKTDGGQQGGYIFAENLKEWDKKLSTIKKCVSEPYCKYTRAKIFSFCLWFNQHILRFKDSYPNKNIRLLNATGTTTKHRLRDINIQTVYNGLLHAFQSPKYKSILKRQLHGGTTYEEEQDPDLRITTDIQQSLTMANYQEKIKENVDQNDAYKNRLTAKIALLNFEGLLLEFIDLVIDYYATASELVITEEVDNDFFCKLYYLVKKYEIISPVINNLFEIQQPKPQSGGTVYAEEETIKKPSKTNKDYVIDGNDSEELKQKINGLNNSQLIEELYDIIQDYKDVFEKGIVDGEGDSKSTIDISKLGQDLFSKMYYLHTKQNAVFQAILRKLNDENTDPKNAMIPINATKIQKIRTILDLAPISPFEYKADANPKEYCIDAILEICGKTGAENLKSQIREKIDSNENIQEGDDIFANLDVTEKTIKEKIKNAIELVATGAKLDDLDDILEQLLEIIDDPSNFKELYDKATGEDKDNFNKLIDSLIKFDVDADAGNIKEQLVNGNFAFITDLLTKQKELQASYNALVANIEASNTKVGELTTFLGNENTEKITNDDNLDKIKTLTRLLETVYQKPALTGGTGNEKLINLGFKSDDNDNDNDKPDTATLKDIKSKLDSIKDKNLYNIKSVLDKYYAEKSSEVEATNTEIEQKNQEIQSTKVNLNQLTTRLDQILAKRTEILEVLNAFVEAKKNQPETILQKLHGGAGAGADGEGEGKSTVNLKILQQLLNDENYRRLVAQINKTLETINGESNAEIVQSIERKKAEINAINEQINAIIPQIPFDNDKLDQIIGVLKEFDGIIKAETEAADSGTDTTAVGGGAPEDKQKMIETFDNMKAGLRVVFDFIEDINGKYNSIYKPIIYFAEKPYLDLEVGLINDWFKAKGTPHYIEGEIKRNYETLADEKTKQWKETIKKESQTVKTKLQEIYNTLQSNFKKDPDNKKMEEYSKAYKTYFTGYFDTIPAASDPKFNELLKSYSLEPAPTAGIDNSNLIEFIKRGVLSSIDILVTQILGNIDKTTVLLKGYYDVINERKKKEEEERKIKLQMQERNRGAPADLAAIKAAAEAATAAAEAALTAKENAYTEKYNDAKKEEYAALKSNLDNAQELIRILKETLSKKLQKDITIFESQALKKNNIAFSVVGNKETGLYQKIYSRYLNDKSNQNGFIAVRNLVTGMKVNNLVPGIALEVTPVDKVIFVFVTLFLRVFSMNLLDTFIAKGWIRSLQECLFLFLVIYTVFFAAFVGIVNIDEYKLRIVFNYVNFDANASLVFTHIGLLYLFTLIIYFLINALNISSFQSLSKIPASEKSKLMYKIELITMITWIFVIIMVIMV